MNARNFWKILMVVILFVVLAIPARSALALGTPQIVSINPSSPAPVGTTVSIRATVNWDNDFRSMRICFRDENWCQEDATPDITKNFDTSGLSAGTYTIYAEVAAKGQGWDTANKVTASYELTASQSQPQPTQPPSSPSISCSVNSFDVSPRSLNVGDSLHIVGNGSCNVGVRATRVILDGNSDIYEIGSPSLSTDWSTSGLSSGQHSIVFQVAAQGDNDWSQAANSSPIYFQVGTPSQPAPAPSCPFNASDVISINGDIYVMDGSCNRHLVPNPDTLDALGISRSWIDNKGLSDSDLNALHRGSDIPDVDRDPSGFAAFKSQYFPDTAPISNGGSPGGSSGSNQQATPYTPFSFSQGDLIKIGSRVYIIMTASPYNEKCWIPNPATLDAMGLSQNSVNNKGHSDNELSTIPDGPNVPDVNIDPNGFNSFMSNYFPNLQSYQPSGNGGSCPAAPSYLKQGDVAYLGDTDVNLRVQPDPNASIITIIPRGQYVTLISGPTCASGVRWFEVSYNGSDGWAAEVGSSSVYHLVPNNPTGQPNAQPTQVPTLINQPTQQQPQGDIGSTGGTNTQCSPQCVTFARQEREDMAIWSPPVSGYLITPKDVLNNAFSYTGKAFPWDYTMQEIRVRAPGEFPQSRDLVIWPQGCGDSTFGMVTFEGGHIGVVASYKGGHLIIEDANWYNQCQYRSEEVTLLSCMKFITAPYLTQGPQSTPEPKPTDTCHTVWWNPLTWFCWL
jgi:uncharacterized protein YraI